MTDLLVGSKIAEPRSQWRTSLVQLLAVGLIATILYAVPLAAPLQGALAAESSVVEREVLSVVVTSIGSSILEGGVDALSVVVTLLAGLYVLVAGGQLSGSLSIPRVQRILATASITLVGCLIPALLLCVLTVLIQPTELGQFMLIAPLGAVIIALGTLLGDFVIYTPLEQIRASNLTLQRTSELAQKNTQKRAELAETNNSPPSGITDDGHAYGWKRRVGVVLTTSLASTFFAGLISAGLLLLHCFDSTLYIWFWFNTFLVLLLGGFVMSNVIALFVFESVRERWSTESAFAKYVTRVAIGAFIALIVASSFAIASSVAATYGWSLGWSLIVALSGPSVMVVSFGFRSRSRISLFGLRRAELDIQGRAEAARKKLLELVEYVDNEEDCGSSSREGPVRRVARRFGYAKADDRGTKSPAVSRSRNTSPRRSAG